MARRLLVKVRSRAGFSLAGHELGPLKNWKPLFTVPAPDGLGFDEGVRDVWAAAEVDDGEENLWEAAHATVADGFGLHGGEVLLAEPDVAHAWPADNERPGFAVAADEKPCTLHRQDQRLGPVGPRDDWHLDDEYTGLRTARDQANGGAGVTIVHLDTGFDPEHATKPEALDPRAQRDFLDDDQDAADTTDRLIANKGHGTATLALIGSRRYGGAPKARIVPCRVGNAVVQFYTSTIAQGLAYATEIGADVLSMSMGGVASFAWAAAVNEAYEKGVVLVTAAGNNFSKLPTRFIVYPARFGRVLAACGVMADGMPYYDRPIGVMQGCHGPTSKMFTAMSAYTPNVPWAKLGCKELVNMDGQGTSSATPQIASAAALWLAKHGKSLPRNYTRVENVRRALFDSCSRETNVGTRGQPDEMLGWGVLKAHKALALGPRDDVRATPKDSAIFAFLRGMTGLGVTAEPPGRDMLRLEMTQLAQSSHGLEEVVPNPDAVSPAQLRRFYEALLSEPRCSRNLKQYLERKLAVRPATQPTRGKPATPRPPGDGAPVSDGSTPRRRIVRKDVTAPPPSRRLRIFSMDPSFGTSFETAHLNETTVEVPWETTPTSSNSLKPGPVGETLEVIDIDPASGRAYAPVDLNDVHLLAQDGATPSEANPKFHQQMVYAVAMTTIRRFELALGRTAMWARHRESEQSDGTDGARRKYTESFMPRLRIHPHALRQANAFYSPRKLALLFGYFPSAPSTEGLPGATVFTCLSHDIIAHETTHALLDGLHPRLKEPSNPDVFAFHEAFADIVAIFQHFTFADLLRHELQRTAGALSESQRLAQLAQQFGHGMGRSVALRSALEPGNTLRYDPSLEPHRLGSVLVAAVFDAFLAIYQRRSEDLLRLTEAAGLRRSQRLPADIVMRLADEAASTADRVLTICVRALDYLPPVDVTFGEYLRALITADADLVAKDTAGYRVAFLEAFRKRGIHPRNVRTYSVESMRWKAPVVPTSGLGLGELIAGMDLTWDLSSDRRNAWRVMRSNAVAFHGWLMKHARGALAEQLGLIPEHPIEVHSVRPARRTAEDGTFRTDLVAVVTQRREEPVDPAQPKGEKLVFRGGCTLIIDTKKDHEHIRYAIMKDFRSTSRLKSQRDCHRRRTGLAALYFSERAQAEPFAFLHSEEVGSW